MKINELVEKYNKNKNIDLSRALDVKKYIGIAYKQQIAEFVLNESLIEVDGNLEMHSLDRYILFTMSVIAMHTNLELNVENDEEYNMLEDFDILSENHLLEKIIDTFREDYDACQIVLDMMTSDKIKNHDTFDKKINRFLNYVTKQMEENSNNNNIDVANSILKLLDTIVEE